MNTNDQTITINNQVVQATGNGFIITIRGKKINLCDPKILYVSNLFNEKISNTIMTICSSGSASQFFTEYTSNVDFNSKIPLLLAFLQDPSGLRKKLGKRGDYMMP